MKIKYHNVRDSTNFTRIMNEEITLENATLSDFEKVKSTNNHVELRSDDNIIIKEFNRYETEMCYAFINGAKDPSGCNCFKYTKRDGKIYESTKLWSFDGTIGKLDFKCMNGEWYIVGKRVRDSNYIITIIDGEIYLMLKNYHSFGNRINGWININDMKVSYDEGEYCKKVVKDFTLEVSKLNIDLDLKDYLCGLLRVG